MKGIITRRPTNDSNIDLALIHDGEQWATALFVNDCGRTYGVQQHKTEAEAKKAYLDRDVRFH